MNQDIEKDDLIEGALNRIDLNPSCSRRQFLKVSGIAVMSLSTFGALINRAGGSAPLVIIDQAEGIVIADPTKCVGCRRCELACTEFNDGKASPTTSRIKVSRNLNFGVKGVFGGQRGQGNWGNGLVVKTFANSALTLCLVPMPARTMPLS